MVLPTLIQVSFFFLHWNIYKAAMTSSCLSSGYPGHEEIRTTNASHEGPEFTAFHSDSGRPGFTAIAMRKGHGSAHLRRPKFLVHILLDPDKW